MGARSRLARILRACVLGDHQAAVALADESDLSELTELAREHGVAPAVYEQLGKVEDLDPLVRHQLAAANLDNRIRRQQVVSDLRYLSALFDSLGSPWLVVKGPAVASLYPSADIRHVGDLDVLVSPSAFERAIDILERAGHPVDDANWALIREVVAGQLHFWLPAGTSLDLHWHLLFNDFERAHFPMQTDELIARRVAVDVSGVNVMTFDPVDTLIHLCLHGATDGGDRLAGLVDIDRAVVVGNPDWDELVARVRGWEMELPVGTMLNRTAHELGTPVPASVVADLLPATWRHSLDALDRVFPVERAARRSGNLASLLTKSSVVGSTPTTAVGAAMYGATRRLRHLARTGSAVRHTRTRTGHVESDLHIHAGEPEDRRSYLTLVGNAASGPASGV